MKTVLNYINLLHGLARRHRGNGTSKSVQSDRRGTAARGLCLSLCLSFLILLCYFSHFALGSNRCFTERALRHRASVPYSRWHHRLWSAHSCTHACTYTHTHFFCCTKLPEVFCLITERECRSAVLLGGRYVSDKISCKITCSTSRNNDWTEGCLQGRNVRAEGTASLYCWIWPYVGRMAL